MRTLIALFVVLSLGGVSVLGALSETLGSLSIPGTQYGLVQKAEVPTTLLLGGDVMLGRSVEAAIEEKGEEYPFAALTEFILPFDIAVANFEGSVPKEHVATKPLEMRFSVPEDYMGIPRAAGFDVLSLANNHAFDYGREGYQNTKSVCEAYSLLCFGTPFEATSTSVAIVNHKGVRIGFLFLHTLFTESDPAVLTQLVGMLQRESDVQIAYIHWGDEYALTHNTDQSGLAYALIDAGIDAVVGHHPHVIQDIEKYRGKPIFYSLGNLIFDQYFSNEVQEGYFVSASLTTEGITYALHPYESRTNRSQPQLLDSETAKTLYERIMPKTIFTDEEVIGGQFAVPFETVTE
jgi:poly-gamma-glutamate capsule biosynthesis protein CapA/YwtB (metallophosphatase superfamily)